MRSVTEEQRSLRPARAQPAGLLDLWRCRGVARRSKIHKGYSPSLRLAPAPNLQQRARSLFMRWVLRLFWRRGLLDVDRWLGLRCSRFTRSRLIQPHDAQRATGRFVDLDQCPP